MSAVLMSEAQTPRDMASVIYQWLDKLDVEEPAWKALLDAKKQVERRAHREKVFKVEGDPDTKEVFKNELAKFYNKTVAGEIVKDYIAAHGRPKDSKHLSKDVYKALALMIASDHFDEMKAGNFIVRPRGRPSAAITIVKGKKVRKKPATHFNVFKGMGLTDRRILQKMSPQEVKAKADKLKVEYDPENWSKAGLIDKIMTKQKESLGKPTDFAARHDGYGNPMELPRPKPQAGRRTAEFVPDPKKHPNIIRARQVVAQRGRRVAKSRLRTLTTYAVSPLFLRASGAFPRIDSLQKAWRSKPRKYNPFMAVSTWQQILHAAHNQYRQEYGELLIAPANYEHLLKLAARWIEASQRKKYMEGHYIEAPGPADPDQETKARERMRVPGHYSPAAHDWQRRKAKGLLTLDHLTVRAPGPMSIMHEAWTDRFEPLRKKGLRYAALRSLDRGLGKVKHIPGLKTAHKIVHAYRKGDTLEKLGNQAQRFASEGERQDRFAVSDQQALVDKAKSIAHAEKSSDRKSRKVDRMKRLRKLTKGGEKNKGRRGLRYLEVAKKLQQKGADKSREEIRALSDKIEGHEKAAVAARKRADKYSKWSHRVEKL